MYPLKYSKTLTKTVSALSKVTASQGGCEPDMSSKAENITSESQGPKGIRVVCAAYPALEDTI